MCVDRYGRGAHGSLYIDLDSDPDPCSMSYLYHGSACTSRFNVQISTTFIDKKFGRHAEPTTFAFCDTAGPRETITACPIHIYPGHLLTCFPVPNPCFSPTTTVSAPCRSSTNHGNHPRSLPCPSIEILQHAVELDFSSSLLPAHLRLRRFQSRVLSLPFFQTVPFANCQKHGGRLQ